MNLWKIKEQRAKTVKKMKKNGRNVSRNGVGSEVELAIGGHRGDRNCDKEREEEWERKKKRGRRKSIGMQWLSPCHREFGDRLSCWWQHPVTIPWNAPFFLHMGDRPPIGFVMAAA